MLRIPLSQLVDPLGLEVPRAPDVSLAGIDSETITLHWIRPDDASSVSKYLIQVNDIIGALSGRCVYANLRRKAAPTSADASLV